MQAVAKAYDGYREGQGIGEGWPLSAATALGGLRIQ